MSNQKRDHLPYTDQRRESVRARLDSFITENSIKHRDVSIATGIPASTISSFICGYNECKMKGGRLKKITDYLNDPSTPYSNHTKVVPTYPVYDETEPQREVTYNWADLLCIGTVIAALIMSIIAICITLTK